MACARGAGIWSNPARPRPLTIIAYISVALGYVGFLLKTSTFAVLTLLSETFIRQNINPNYVAPDISPGEFAFAAAVGFAGLITSLLSLAGGIGLLKMRRWGRSLLMMYAAAALTLVLVNGIRNVATFDRRFELSLSATTRPDEQQELADTKNQTFLVSLVAPVALMIWPAAVLSILTRPYAKAALRVGRER
jgi:hypothetical protein